jgi:hypothetical protein
MIYLRSVVLLECGQKTFNNLMVRPYVAQRPYLITQDETRWRLGMQQTSRDSAAVRDRLVMISFFRESAYSLGFYR